jgi:hypothetical protein
LIGTEGTDSCGIERSLETPQARVAPRRLKDLPAESECPERKSTGQLAGTLFLKLIF